MAVNYTRTEVEQNFYAKQFEIGRVSKNKSTDIVISACVDKKGNELISIREWYVQNEEWKPAKSGINIKLENLLDVCDCVEEAIKYLKDKK